jgi:hypothetical protein
MRWHVTFECQDGHIQELHYETGFTADMVHDHAVLIAGGTLSIGIEMPGYPCIWQAEPGAGVCGKKVAWTMREET